MAHITQMLRSAAGFKLSRFNLEVMTTFYETLEESSRVAGELGRETAVAAFANNTGDSLWLRTLSQ